MEKVKDLMDHNSRKYNQEFHESSLENLSSKEEQEKYYDVDKSEDSVHIIKSLLDYIKKAYFECLHKNCNYSTRMRIFELINIASNFELKMKDTHLMRKRKQIIVDKKKRKISRISLQ